MRLLFWVATALEWQAAYPQYTGALPEQTLPDQTLPEQTLLDFTDAHGRSHLLCITGVGPVNAALAAGLCLGQLQNPAPEFGKVNAPAFAKVDAAVNLGVAGSFDLNRAPLGSAWRVTREIWPEYGLACGNTVDARALGFAQWQHEASEKTVWDSVDLPDPAHTSLQAHLSAEILALPTATSLTVAGVTADTERAAHLYARHNALLENMEGFALALACARHNLPLLELRTVSNAVGPREPEPRPPGTARQRDFPKALTALQPLLRNLLNLSKKG